MVDVADQDIVTAALRRLMDQDVEFGHDLAIQVAAVVAAAREEELDLLRSIVGSRPFATLMARTDMAEIGPLRMIYRHWLRDYGPQPK